MPVVEFQKPVTKPIIILMKFNWRKFSSHHFIKQHFQKMVNMTNQRAKNKNLK